MRPPSKAQSTAGCSYSSFDMFSKDKTLTIHSRRYSYQSLSWSVMFGCAPSGLGNGRASSTARAIASNAPLTPQDLNLRLLRPDRTALEVLYKTICCSTAHLE